MKQHVVTLPWPPKELSPNNPSWRAKIRPKKQYRAACHEHCIAAGVRKIKADRVKVNVIFHPPDNRRRDRDNMIAAFKAGQDGVADCIGVDDADWCVSYAFLPPEKPGKIQLTIREA